MKKSVSLLFIALLLCTLSIPALAAEETPSVYYPISVEEYTYGPLDELRVDTVFAMLQTNKLLLHLPAAIWANFIAIPILPGCGQAFLFQRLFLWICRYF